MDYTRVPSAVFTYPEVASVGLSEKAAREAGQTVQVAKFPYSASGKAVTIGETEGLVKIVADQKGRLLGLHIFGENAADLIHEGALALTLGASVQDIVRTIHAHPTLAETIHEAAH
ncbi:MAG: dihydrolipoyl dehydrogenase, partial [Firmicutes bacterium]|nr:dihydrolipoyl dehydrogenase [Bacillota bacterium]